MTLKRTLPLNLTVFALAAVLLRAEAKAEIKVELDHKARGKDARDRHGKGQASVRNRGHSGSHPRTLRKGLRERARLFEPYIAAAAALWIFAGPDLVNWYKGLIASALGAPH